MQESGPRRPVRPPPLFAGARQGHYPCIAIDPPWHHSTWSPEGRGRSVRYRTLTLAELEALPVGDYAARDAFLFLWIPGPFLAVGAHLPLMRSWGFAPSAMGFVWLKSTKAARWGAPADSARAWRMGLGKTTRQNAEYVVLGRRGEPRRLSAGVRQEIIAVPREHSRKPDEFYERVERFCVGPRIDVFGRQRRAGWTVVGDQADLFKQVQTYSKEGRNAA